MNLVGQIGRVRQDTFGTSKSLFEDRVDTRLVK